MTLTALDRLSRCSRHILLNLIHMNALISIVIPVNAMLRDFHCPNCMYLHPHFSDVIMGATASEITGVTIVNSAVCSSADHRKHQISASLAFVRGIHRSPVNSPHKGPVTRKMFPFDDVIILIFTYMWHMSKYLYVWLYADVRKFCLSRSLSLKITL